MPRHRIVPQMWSNVLQDFVEIPLDDADPWLIEVARQVAGKDIGDQDFIVILNRSQYVKRKSDSDRHLS